MTKTKKYALTDEHRAQLAPWAQRWIANALSTKPMDKGDRAAMVAAIEELYRAAGLTPPPRHRIVFVPSPFVALVAGGFAAAIWSLRTQKTKTGRATRAATAAATAAATRDATWAATRDATEAEMAATVAATRDATEAAMAATAAATRAATAAATEAAMAATEAATMAATWDATEAATEAATEGDRWYVGMQGIRQMAQALVPDHPDLAVACAAQASRMWDGGNQWSGYPAWLSFFRHVVKLPLDYAKWQHYEAAAIHGGHRVMHAQFCLVADRPRVLTVDDQSRPHNETGPFCRWVDGTALYAWHGVRVPWWVIEHPERITAERVQQEPNAEVRRAMIERRGWDWYVDAMGMAPVQQDAFGRLYRTTIDEAEVGIVVVTSSTPEPDGTVKHYALMVPPEHQTAHAAIAWTFGLTADTYRPLIET